MFSVASSYDPLHPPPIRFGDNGQEWFADQPGLSVAGQDLLVQTEYLDVLEMAVWVGERCSHQIIAEEQPGTVQHLSEQRCAAAVKTCHDQLITQGLPFCNRASCATEVEYLRRLSIAKADRAPRLTLSNVSFFTPLPCEGVCGGRSTTRSRRRGSRRASGCAARSTPPNASWSQGPFLLHIGPRCACRVSWVPRVSPELGVPTLGGRGS